MSSRPAVFRVLIVEDNLGRMRLLQHWLPDGMRAVVATSAGQAMGLLRRDRGRVYGAILLDHDLQELIAADSDRGLSGSDVADAIIAYTSRDVPILVHSVNASQAPRMVEKLARAGFDVTEIPMSALTAERLAQWLRDAQAAWSEMAD